MSQQISDISDLSLRSVVDEYFPGFQRNASGCVVMFQYGFCQERIPLFRGVSVKRVNASHLVDGFVHGIDGSLWQRAGDISCPQADQMSLGMSNLERIDLFLHVEEKMIVRQFQ